jgi:FixJ family two-component response regulator
LKNREAGMISQRNLIPIKMKTIETIQKKPESQDKKLFSIFVVDDDEAFLFALAFHLKKDTNWKVYCYPSVEECLCYLHLNPDVIVMDYYFDKAGENCIDGMMALKMLKSLKPKIPVIMLSAQDDVKISIDLLKSGAFTYIVKDRATLAAIEKILRGIEKSGIEKSNVA